MKRYISNYFKIYITQGISLVLGFISMFIVTPFISSNKAVFGIYSVCLSVSIFLSYADLGFLGAGKKFASEEYARKNKELEMRYLGFSGFILLIFVLIFSLIFFIFSKNPTILIENLTSDNIITASKLFLILAIFAPAIAVLRITQTIYGIRIEDYLYQRVVIIGNIFKILASFYFFRTGIYDIVGYYLTFHIVNVVVSLITFSFACKQYSYGIKGFIAAVKFDKSIFDKTKHFAINSLYLTLSWLLIAELDNLVIGKLLGAEIVAVYAIGLTLMTFTRTLLGSIYQPFVSRFNHYIGENDFEGLKKAFNDIIIFTIPLVIYPIITIVILVKPIIFSWVGPEYIKSVNIARFLILSNLFAFITYPTGILLSAQLRLREMYLIGLITPLVYWGGIIGTNTFLGVESFSVFKFVAFLATAIVYIIKILDYMNFNILIFFKKYALWNVPSLILLFAILKSIYNQQVFYKDRVGLIQNFVTAILVSFLCILIAYLTNKDTRTYIFRIINGLKERF